jgi:TetR/AcrR family transcriptional regulator, repressor for neighboring sulfatase
VQHVLSSWLEQEPDLLALVEALADLYRRGYGELAIALHAAGWRDRGSGLLDPVVDALHQLRPPTTTTTIDDTRLAVAALHQALATEPLYGSAFRRSAGLTGTAATDPTGQLRWWTRQLRLALDLAPADRRPGGR